MHVIKYVVTNLCHLMRFPQNNILTIHLILKLTECCVYCVQMIVKGQAEKVRGHQFLLSVIKLFVRIVITNESCHTSLHYNTLQLSQIGLND